MDAPESENVVVQHGQDVGLVAFMIQHADGQVQLVSYPEGDVRVRGLGFDAIWPDFLERLGKTP
jgi:hypothetical protein